MVESAQVGSAQHESTIEISDDQAAGVNDIHVAISDLDARDEIRDELRSTEGLLCGMRRYVPRLAARLTGGAINS